MHGQEGEHQEHVRDRPRRPRQVHTHRLSCLQGGYNTPWFITESRTELNTVYQDSDFFTGWHHRSV